MEKNCSLVQTNCCSCNWYYLGFTSPPRLPRFYHVCAHTSSQRFPLYHIYPHSYISFLVLSTLCTFIFTQFWLRLDQEDNELFELQNTIQEGSYPTPIYLSFFQLYLGLVPQIAMFLTSWIVTYSVAYW